MNDYEALVLVIGIICGTLWICVTTVQFFRYLTELSVQTAICELERIRQDAATANPPPDNPTE
jgi:hypothetical protein